MENSNGSEQQKIPLQTSETASPNDKNPDQETLPKKNVLNEAFEWLESCVFALVIVLLIFTFFFRSSIVTGPSMLPTLNDGDRLVLQQIGYNDPKYGDIVVLDRTQTDEPPIIKRVIGKAGDEIDIDFQTGLVYRNGEKLEESYTNEPTTTQYDVQFPIIIPEGTIFVLGDNRNHSADSRLGDIGMIDLRNVMGKALVRFLPINNIGVI